MTESQKTPVAAGNKVAPLHPVAPHLVCRGAAEAIAFYKKAFGAVETMRLPGPANPSPGAARALSRDWWSGSPPW